MSKKFIKNTDDEQYKELTFDKKQAGKEARAIRQKKSRRVLHLIPRLFKN